MKAQLSVEYYISLTIFIGFIVYISFQVMRISPQFITEVKNERLKSEAYQISELLINDAGEPINWDSQSSVKRIGLSNNLNKTNLLSQEKIDAFNTSCSSGYDNIRKLMGIGTEYYFSLKLIDSNSGQTLIDCNPPLTVIKPAKVAITRITALSPTTFGELTLQLW
jgi:hypothetical protein